MIGNKNPVSRNGIPLYGTMEMAVSGRKERLENRMENAGRQLGGVQSIRRAFAIIELLESRGEMGIADMGRFLDLERSTVHRIVSTLKNLDYLSQNPANHKYFNSFRFFDVGNSVVKRLGLRQQAAPFLRELSEKTREAVNLAILDCAQVLFIDKIESLSTIKVDLSVGKRFPVYCTGLGKALLAWLPESRQREILQACRFVKYTQRTKLSPDLIMEDLQEVRRRGYSMDDEEYVEGILCIAAPVFGHSGEVVAALSIALPKFLYAADGPKTEPVRVSLVDSAERFSRSLGSIVPTHPEER